MHTVLQRDKNKAKLDFMEGVLKGTSMWTIPWGMTMSSVKVKIVLPISDSKRT